MAELLQNPVILVLLAVVGAILFVFGGTCYVKEIFRKERDLVKLERERKYESLDYFGQYL